MPSTHVQTALAWIAHIDARDYPALEALLSDNFTHRILPASVGGFGMPVRNKREFVQHLKRLEAVIGVYNYQPPQEIIEAEGVVIVHVAADGKTTAGEPYTNEYMFTFRFEGEKILSVKAFMDSAHVTSVVGSKYASE